MEGGGVAKKLRSKVSVYFDDSWWEERFFMDLFLKFIYRSWRIQHLAPLKFLGV